MNLDLERDVTATSDNENKGCAIFGCAAVLAFVLGTSLTGMLCMAFSWWWIFSWPLAMLLVFWAVILLTPADAWEER